VTVVERWEADGDGVVLVVDIVPSARWDLVWPRVGVRFELPTAVDGAEWFGTGPGESYPDSRNGVLVGRYRAGIEELTFPYAWPQESGHRSDLRQLDLASMGAPWLRLDAAADARGRRPGFTLSPHTPQQIDRARHPHELPTPVRTHLTIDAAQNGLGSRACGPDVWPDALLRPEARSLRLRLTELRSGIEGAA
jgi:beta-galactosidase